MCDAPPDLDSLPRRSRADRLRFACHPGVPCFNACCRELTLELSPYDVIRLRKVLNLGSQAFIEARASVERHPETGFPLVLLRMGTDGVCVFVQENGCTIYPERPAACRCYPLGRAVGVDEAGNPLERIVEVREPHCRGFEEPTEQTVEEWLVDQGLEPYLASNDRLARLVARWLTREEPLGDERFRMVFLALYRLDAFREFIADKRWFASLELPEGRREAILTKDEARLPFALDWLEAYLFEERTVGGLPLRV